MKHICAKCDVNIEYGAPVVQMLRGPWYNAITPAFTSLDAEWHRECFNEFVLLEAGRPYKCVECLQQIGFGAQISFLVKGEGTDQYSTVAEKRGDTIFSPKHLPKCPDCD